MGCITQGQLRVTGAININEVENLKIKVVANEHARAYFKGRLDEDYIRIVSSKNQQPVKIMANDNTLFVGLVNESKCIIEGEYTLIEVWLVSSTILLDDKKRCKSYQDVKKKIKDIMEEALQVDGMGSIDYQADETSIVMPVIQYQETNWAFIRRLASRAGTCLYPSEKTDIPHVCIGLPNNGKTEINILSYEILLSDKCFKRNICNKELYKGDYLYYKVKNYDDLPIGSNVVFMGNSVYIFSKEVELIKSEVIFTYILGNIPLVNLKRYDNELFAGMTILGTVLSTNKETLRLKFNIDEEQDESTAYDYKWTPETGNFMYCMPEKGTEVALYFKNQSEESATIVSCVRKNGMTCSVMDKTEDRYLTTTKNKQLFLKPDSIGFDAKESGNSFVISDTDGINVLTPSEVTIIAKKEVAFEAKKVLVQTPNELQMRKL